MAVRIFAQSDTAHVEQNIRKRIIIPSRWLKFALTIVWGEFHFSRPFVIRLTTKCPVLLLLRFKEARVTILIAWFSTCLPKNLWKPQCFRTPDAPLMKKVLWQKPIVPLLYQKLSKTRSYHNTPKDQPVWIFWAVQNKKDFGQKHVNTHQFYTILLIFSEKNEKIHIIEGSLCKRVKHTEPYVRLRLGLFLACSHFWYGSSSCSSSEKTIVFYTPFYWPGDRRKNSRGLCCS